MKTYIGLLLIFQLTLLSCSSVKNNPMESPYNHFRKTQKTFASSEGNLKYIDEGSGEKVILLLHGVPSSSWLYRKVIPELTSKGFIVIAPDMLGYGNSDSPKGYDIYSEAEHAKRLIALMDDLKIQKWHHVMHDAGGLWTWEIFKQAPDRIHKLSVLNTIILEEGFKPPIRMKKNIFSTFSMWLYKNGFTTNMMLKALFNQTLNDKYLLTTQDKEGYKTPLLEGKTRGMYYFFTQTCNTFPDIQSVIEQIDIPIQIIWGKNDNMLQLEPQLNLLKKYWSIHNKDIHWLDAKHFIQEEKPKEISQLISDF